MSKSLAEQLAKESLTAGGARQKKPSGHGKGKWQNSKTLDAYRKKRNATRKARKR